MSELIIKGADFVQGRGKSLIIKGADFNDIAIGHSYYFGMHQIFAPADWKIENEPFNLAKAFHDSNLPCKRFAFTVSDNVESTVLSTDFTGTDVGYIYETLQDGTIKQTIAARNGTVSFTEGSTNRYGIVVGRKVYQSKPPTITFTNGCKYDWIHIGDSIAEIENMFYATTVRLITVDNSDSLNTVLSRYRPPVEGILDYPERVTTLGGSNFWNNNIKAVVIRSKNVPSTDPYTTDPFDNLATGVKVFVPDESLEAYKAAWTTPETLNRLTPLSEYRREDYITQS